MIAITGRFSRVLLASYFLLAGGETGWLQISQAEEPSPTASGLAPVNSAGPNGQTSNPAKALRGASAGKIGYQRVAANLDRDGLIYLFWNAEKALGESDKKLGSIAETALSDPTLSPAEKNSLQQKFALGIGLLHNSGLQGVKAFGFSSREIEPGLFLNKSYTYLPDRSGFLWDTFAKAPHDFQFLKMIPENTEGFAFFDCDLALFWGAVSKELVSSEIPEAARWQQHFSQQVQAFTGLSLHDVLASLGDQVGIILTLNRKTMVRIPVGAEQYELPEPAAALVWKVRNDKLFDRLDALFSLNPKVSKIDDPNLRLRVMEGVAELPYLTPTLARLGEYLIVSSSEKLVRGMMEAESGKPNGMRSSADFQALSVGLPEKGNSVAYVAKSLQQTLSELQKFAQLRESANPLQEGMLARIFGLMTNAANYTVGGIAEDGWFTAGKTTKDANEIIGEFLTLPAYYLAATAVDQVKQARGTEKLIKIKKNLANLRTAKDEAISERNLPEGQMLNRQDIEEYLAAWPDSVVGETYEVGIVGLPPFATAPVDVGEYRAGMKIEP